MPTYITQGRYTRDALKGMIVKPEDRADQVARLISKVGGRLIGYYVTFGDYDFLAIAEARDVGSQAFSQCIAFAAARDADRGAGCRGLRRWHRGGVDAGPRDLRRDAVIEYS